MQWRVEMENGKTINVGFGGVHRSLLRLAGNVVRTTAEHPENWKSLSAEKNPLMQWVRGHMATATQMALTGISGEDYFGNEADAVTIARSALPLTIQQGFRQEGQPEATGGEYAASFVGINARPESQHKTKQRAVQETAREQTGKPYDELSIVEQAKVQRVVKKDERFSDKEPASLRVIELAARADLERKKRIHDGLSSASQKKLKSLKLSVGGYEPEISFGKKQGRVAFPMTDKQRDVYEKALISEYDRMVSVIDEVAWSKMTPATRQIFLNARKKGAQNRAEAAMRRAK
jgi:hypothetical protein